MAREPIRLRLVPRETIKHHKNPREEFWHAIKDDELRDQSISKLEAKLCREFGEELRGQLIRHLRRPLDQLLEVQDRNLNVGILDSMIVQDLKRNWIDFK